MMRTAAVAAVIVAAIGLLAMSALQQSRRANKLAKERDRQFKAATRSLYAANLNLAQQAWEQQQPNVSQVRQLLKENVGYADRDFEWYYWQRQTHVEFKTLRGHLLWVTAVAFSPDNRRVVTGSWDRTAKVWDATDGQELLTLSEHANWIWSVAFSADNQRVATGSGDQTATVWDATTGQELLTLKAHTAGIRSVAFSPDKRYFLEKFGGTK